ncbi:hypothetical protein EYZ11_001411 [Aspergillus tanneri]|uniref:Uncharacterized protein n=1 Tax=Aspergillus tanneri TaxID=1220188 RepID=A0A4V3UQL8_9EURO|nr:hypothetical protein EYZ11_001411 [Aspergillus tanneri]
MALNPPSKRPAQPGRHNGSAAARKRAKTYDARTLAVQSADAALSASGELDVAAYVGSREFEIRALEVGIQRSKTALTTQLMRIRLETARRLQNLNSKTKAKRAASKAKHCKETQKSLEESGAHAFNIAPRVPKIKKYKLSRPPPPDSKYKKRQRHKTWLPTHMFHAKRAHMTTTKDPLWRFAIPLSPTEKSYRPSHRAKGVRGAVAWDMSYMSTIQLEGTEPALESVLRAVGINGEDAWGPRGRKWRAGTRSLPVWTFERERLERPIAPVTLIQCAEARSEDVEMLDADNTAAQNEVKKKMNRKKIFVRVHPAAFLQLWNELLKVSKQQNPPVMIEDLRFEIGSIDITGPGSAEALISALKPLTEDGKEAPENSPEATWGSLLGVSNPSSLPQNALIAFSASDPRLHFPPTKMKPRTSDTEMQNLAVLLSTWPIDKTQTPPTLFDRRARLAAARQLPSQKAINRRRTEAGPGVYAAPLPSDPKIPIIVLATRSIAQSRNSNAPGTWTVLLPWKCVLPVWYSLMYCPLSSGGNPRFGGLKEQQQLAFEAGEPWFPGDFPGTNAGWEWGLRERENSKQEWERRPKGRRAEFDSLDLGNGKTGEIGRGWACDWEKLAQIASNSAMSASKITKKTQSSKAQSDTVSNAEANPQNDVTTAPPLGIHQLQPAKASRAINGPPTTNGSGNPALATVQISLFKRGTPTPRARIYRLPTTNPELRQKWLSLASNKTAELINITQERLQSSSVSCDPAVGKEHIQQRLAASLISLPAVDDPRQEYLPLPLEEDLIGFVTTGNYNLSEGKGTGIGSIMVSKVMSQSGQQKTKAREQNMCIVRGAGERVGRLGYWNLV